MIDILARRRKNNPIVVGEAGVGKTAAVEGLALRIVQDDVPEVLKDVSLLSLDLGLLQAGAGVRGEFENRLKSVINEVKASPKPIILFIDEAHTLIGAGGVTGGSDAANLLKPALARGELAHRRSHDLVGIQKVLRKGCRPGQALSACCAGRAFRGRRRHDPAEGSATNTRNLTRSTSWMRPSWLRPICPAAISPAGSCPTRRWICSTRLRRASRSDSAAGLMFWKTSWCAFERSSGNSAPWSGTRKAGVDVDEERIAAAGKRDRRREGGVPEPRGAVESSSTMTPRASWISGSGSGTCRPEERRTGLKAELEQVKEELEKVREGDPLISLEVNPDVIAKVVADWTGIPVGKMVKDEAQPILSLQERLATRIKGQDQALEMLARGIRAAKAGLANPSTPIGVFLFVGPSGVGKTEAALSLADTLFGGERFMVTINMSEFQEKHTVSRLIGSPPGYVGFGEGGVLTEAVRQRPYSVVLMDEVEKADPEVLNLFYQVFDKGMLSDGEGRVIDFKNTVIIMTSNLASDLITSICMGDARPAVDDLIAAIRPVLSRHFRPALLARMTIVPFYPIDQESMKEIVELKLGQLGSG